VGGECLGLVVGWAGLGQAGPGWSGSLPAAMGGEGWFCRDFLGGVWLVVLWVFGSLSMFVALRHDCPIDMTVP
jgi:hypothetical protein